MPGYVVLSMYISRLTKVAVLSTVIYNIQRFVFSFFFMVGVGILIGVASGQNCADDKVRKCISIAEPMLKDPHLIFPDNMNDINNVCRYNCF